MKTSLLIAALVGAVLVPAAAQDDAPSPTMESLSRSVQFLVKRVGELEKKTRDLEGRVKQLESSGPALGQARDGAGADRRVRRRVVELGAGPKGEQQSAVFVLEAVKPAQLPEALAVSLKGAPPPVWMLGWDGQRDIMVLSFGPAKQYEMMVGQSMQCSGVLIESAGDDAKIDFKTLFATKLMVMPGPPKNLAERTRDPIWDQPDYPRFPPDFDWR
ncbi:MAG: hypothetical protein ACYSUF_05490 [Planctomycetota bacterium]|jgi:hypothetical protein